MSYDYLWFLDASKDTFRPQLEEIRETSVKELIPNAPGLGTLGTFVHTVMSNPDEEFNLIYHVFGPGQPTPLNLENIEEAFESFEATMATIERLRGFAPHLKVHSLDDLIKNNHLAMEDELGQWILNDQIPNRLVKHDSAKLLDVAFGLTGSGPRIVSELDINVSDLKPDLERYPDSDFIISSRHPFERHFGCDGHNFVAEPWALYAKNPQVPFYIKTLERHKEKVSQIIETNDARDSWDVLHIMGDVFSEMIQDGSMDCQGVGNNPSRFVFDGINHSYTWSYNNGMTEAMSNSTPVELDAALFDIESLPENLSQMEAEEFPIYIEPGFFLESPLVPKGSWMTLEP